MSRIVLAFDIERSGATDEYDTIAIGASVVDEDYNELASLFLPCYLPNQTVFEQRCWDEFWSKHPDKLSELKYDGDLTKTQREREAIEEFQAFRATWENYADQSGFKYELVADNNVYDGAFINQLLFKYTNSLPIPYNTKGKFKAFWETHSEQRGLLMAVDPTYDKNHGFSKRINELYNITLPSNKVHDHNPANDAYTIACEQQVLNNIRLGKHTLHTASN